jgi:hypothetical protein
MAWTHGVIDFSLPKSTNSDEVINELDKTHLNNGILRSEQVYKDDKKYIRLYVLFRIHDPLWKNIDDHNSDLTVTLQNSTEIKSKAYLYSNAPNVVS